MTITYRFDGRITPIEYTGEVGIDLDGQQVKHSPQWRGLNEKGKPLSVNCHNHVEVGICEDCAWNLSQVLADIPMLFDDLDIAIAGESHFVEHGTRAGRLALGEATGARNPAIAAQKRLTLAMRGDGTNAHPGVSDWFDSRDPARMSLHLARQMPWLRGEPRMPTLGVDISSASSRAHRIIDAPVDMVYYGQCPDCGRDIVQERIHHEDTTTPIKCGYPSCDYARSLDEHQAAQLMANLDKWLTVNELVSAFTLGGIPVTRNQIHWWAKHEGLPREARVRPKWRNGELIAPTADTYRVGDVLDLAQRAEEKRQARIASRQDVG